MSPYRVFLAKEVLGNLRRLSSREQGLVTRLFDGLAANPFQTGDYVESDDLGRPVQVAILGRHALYFWVDHAVCEVKVLDLRRVGN